MYEIEAGERRSLTEEVIGRTYNLELKKEEEIPGGVRCFYGYVTDLNGFLEVIYLDNIVLDSKIHEDIHAEGVDEIRQEQLEYIAETGRDRKEVEDLIKRKMFHEPVGKETKDGNIITQKYGVKNGSVAIAGIQVCYDINGKVVDKKLIPDEEV